MEYLTGLQILRLNVAGTPVEWLDWQETVTLYSRGMVAWSHGEPLTEVYGGTNRRSGLRSSAPVHGIIACRGAILKQSRQIPALSNRALFSRDHHLCLYCGQQFPSAQLTRDHVIPVSKGGSDKWTNLVTACKRCNQRKGDRSPEACDMPLLAVPYRPNRAEYLALINGGRIRCDQMSFLSSHFSRNWQQHRVRPH